MKTLSVSLLAIFLGGAIGVATTWSEFAAERGADLLAATGDKSLLPEIPGAAAAGKAEVDVIGASDFDFGVMEKGATQRHTFILKNVGKAPAVLRKGDTTCKCTLSELAKDQLQPGEMAEVALEWTPVSFAPAFRQSAHIHVQPGGELIRLEVHGRVVQSVRAMPEELTLSNVSTSEPRTATSFVYCYRQPDFSVQFERLGRTESAKHFEVAIVPLTADEVAQQPEALAGVKVNVTVKPGLPLGHLEQTVHLTTNVAEAPTLEIPVRGSISGDISVVGARSLYDTERKIVTLGNVPRATGGKFHLQLLVKGPRVRDVKFSVGEVDPADALQVQVDMDHFVKVKQDDSVRMYPLTITVPPHSPAVSRLGGTQPGQSKLGRITIKTTHPQAPQVLLYVQFAVEG
jgi:hypothetical protein